jgi:hypothetical protein
MFASPPRLGSGFASSLGGNMLVSRYVPVLEGSQYYELAEPYVSVGNEVVTIQFATVAESKTAFLIDSDQSTDRCYVQLHDSGVWVFSGSSNHLFDGVPVSNGDSTSGVFDGKIHTLQFTVDAGKRIGFIGCYYVNKSLAFEGQLFSFSIGTTRYPLSSGSTQYELPEGVGLGASVVPNGDFSATDNWILNSPAWDLSSGQAVCDGSQGGWAGLQDHFALTFNKWYVISADITVSAGSVRIGAGENYLISAIESRSYSGVGQPADNNHANVLGDAAYIGTVDNVSWQELPGTALIAHNFTTDHIETYTYETAVTHDTGTIDAAWMGPNESRLFEYWSTSHPGITVDANTGEVSFSGTQGAWANAKIRHATGVDFAPLYDGRYLLDWEITEHTSGGYQIAVNGDNPGRKYGEGRWVYDHATTNSSTVLFQNNTANSVAKVKLHRLSHIVEDSGYALSDVTHYITPTNWVTQVNALPPGAVAQFLAGTYVGTGQTIDVQGTESQPILLRGWGHLETTLDAQDAADSIARITGAANLRVENFVITNDDGVDGRTTRVTSGVNREGLIVGGSENIWIRYNVFRNIARRGIFTSNVSPGLVITDNLFYLIGHDTAGGDININGGNNWLVENNLLVGQVDGFVMDGANCYGGTLRRNIFGDHRQENAIDFKQHDKNDTGNTTTVTENIIYHNEDGTYFASEAPILVHNGSRNLTFDGNVIYGSGPASSNLPSMLLMGRYNPSDQISITRNKFAGFNSAKGIRAYSNDGNVFDDCVVSSNWFDDYTTPIEITTGTGHSVTQNTITDSGAINADPDHATVSGNITDTSAATGDARYPIDYDFAALETSIYDRLKQTFTEAEINAALASGGLSTIS